jgi:hypothetical protein
MLRMESRQEARFEVDQEITVTLLGEVESTFAGKIVNVSGRGMCFLSSQELSAGAAIKIELSDTMVLGEVIYCRRQEAHYQAGIALEQALYHTQDLAVLAERLLGGGTRSRAYDKEVMPL